MSAVIADKERVKPTYDARGELVIDKQLADEEAGYGIDPTTHELFAWADDGMIVISIDPAVMLPLANHALPDGHPLKLGWSDVRLLEGIASDYPHGSSVGEYGDRLRATAAKLRALLPPEA